MRTDRLSKSTLAIVLAIAAGCGGSSAGGNGSGGETASGGSGSPGSGGTTTGSGGTSTGGATGSGGGSGGNVGTGGGSGGKAASGGSTGSGGGSGGNVGTGGGSGGAASGGATGSGGSSGGSPGSGGATGGHVGSGGAGGQAQGGRAGGASGGSPGSGGTTNPGTCTASKASGNASGTGPHKVTMETNSDPGISEGTIFRPTDLSATEKYPIFVWGEGGCSQSGTSNSVAMGEIASHGYFVIADGTPNGSGNRTMDTSNIANMGKPLLAYITWAIAENDKPCSAYYQHLDTTKIGANGFSCGGLMSEGTAGDPRITTWGLNSSGLFASNPTFYKTVHTPVLIVLGGSDDIAYENGERDYMGLAAQGTPIMLFSKALGHGGDLFSSHGGDFTKIDLAWLNWQLKGDETATGKGVLVGSTCTYCKDSAWEVKSMNIQ